DERDEEGDAQFNAFYHHLQLHLRLTLIQIGHLIGTLTHGTGLRTGSKASDHHREEDARHLHGLDEIRALGHHLRHRYRLHLVLDEGVARRLGRNLHHLLVLAASGVEYAEDPAEYLQVELVKEGAYDGQLQHIFVDEKLTTRRPGKHDPAEYCSQTQQDDPPVVVVHPSRKGQRQSREEGNIDLETGKEAHHCRHDAPDIPDEGGDGDNQRYGRHGECLSDVLPELVLALQVFGGGLEHLCPVAALGGEAQHVGRELAQHVLVLHEGLARIHAATQIAAQVAKHLLECRIRRISGE